MKPALLRAAILVLALRLIWMYVIPAWNEITTDFPNYYTPAWSLRHDRPIVDLYDPAWFQRETTRAGMPGRLALFSAFPVFSALVMWPIANFPPLTAMRIWLIVNLLALSIAVILVAKFLKAPRVEVLLIALLGGDALGNNFTFGQFYIVLTLLLVVTILHLDRFPVLAAFCLSVAAAVKVFPAMFIAHLALLRRWKVILWTIVSVVALTAIGVAVMGWSPHRVYLEEVLGRSLRGEIQDPYNVHANTLQALLRRALVAEPSLNPNPIIDLPSLFFFLRPFLGFTILVTTLFSIRSRAFTLIEYGALMAAISLVTPSQASYHQILFFPAIAAAIHAQPDFRIKTLWAASFALICSNYMGVFTGFDSGPAMILAFPRVVLVLSLWIAFLNKRGLKLGPSPRSVLLAASLISVVSALFEYRQWSADTRDGARMARPEEAGRLEMYPTVGSGGLLFSSMRPGGYAFFKPSAFGDGLVYETNDGIQGKSPDGTGIQGVDLIEPALGPNSVIALRGESVLEKTFDADWKELFRRETIIHDPVLSPDGSAVAFSEWVGGRYRISEWKRETGEIGVLLSGPEDYRYPAYHPTGLWLTFATNQTGNWDIARLSFLDGRRDVLTTSKANDLMPVYSIDGARLFFSSDRRRGYRFTAIYAIALSR